MLVHKRYSSIGAAPPAGDPIARPVCVLVHASSAVSDCPSLTTDLQSGDSLVKMEAEQLSPTLALLSSRSTLHPPRSGTRVDPRPISTFRKTRMCSLCRQGGMTVGFLRLYDTVDVAQTFPLLVHPCRCSAPSPGHRRKSSILTNLELF